MFRKATASFITGLALLLLVTGQVRPQGRLVYTQLVVGSGFQTILLLTNPSADTWTGSLRVPEFGAGSGVAWLVNDLDLTGLQTHPIELGPWETRRYVLSGIDGQPVLAGSLWIDPVVASSQLASAFFYRLEMAGELVDEVATPPAQPTQRIVLPVEFDLALQVNTGLAM